MKERTMIYFMNDTDIPVEYALKLLVRRAIISSLDYEGFENKAEVSVTFTDNEGIKALNKDYRSIDKETDVLSFPLVDFDGGEEPPINEETVGLGDIVISLEKAQAQAEEYGHSFEREVAFLTVHSMLHLLGYDHVNSDEEDAEMRQRQSEILIKMGLGVK
ncbi:MAG: rRNA maturation RNase YbeY [Clostridia bacterium]|nr:rRNA maturation RNase YbeY [Clostridia bacterium]